MTFTNGILSILLCCVAVMNSSCTACPRPEIHGRQEGRECVILLHGLARTSSSMKTMEKGLLQAGYQIVNLDYSSREKTIEDIAAQDVAGGVTLCEQAGAGRIHFVTHSLGGIVVRLAMRNQKPEKLGRVVMLAPPNQGSFVTDRLKKWWFYRRLNGPAGQELGTGSESLPNRIGPVDYPVGVIAGNRHAFFDAWFASFIPDENDGKVAVEHTRVDGMADFLLVPETHPFIMNADKVIEETIYFLRQGTFIRP